MDNSMRLSTALTLTALALPALLALGCGPPTPSQVSFRNQIEPILAKHCVSCHVEGKPGTEASGLQLDSYAALMKGTRFGSVVVPGDPLSSVFNALVEGRADPSIKMPYRGHSQLSTLEIQQLRDWVQQGARDN